MHADLGKCAACSSRPSRAYRLGKGSLPGPGAVHKLSASAGIRYAPAPACCPCWAQLLRSVGPRCTLCSRPSRAYRLGQGGLRGGAPVHGLPAAVNVPPRDHAAEHAQLGRLVRWVQREVGPLPLAPHAKPGRAHGLSAGAHPRQAWAAALPSAAVRSASACCVQREAEPAPVAPPAKAERARPASAGGPAAVLSHAVSSWAAWYAGSSRRPGWSQWPHTPHPACARPVSCPPARATAKQTSTLLAGAGSHELGHAMNYHPIP